MFCREITLNLREKTWLDQARLGSVHAQCLCRESPSSGLNLELGGCFCKGLETNILTEKKKKKKRLLGVIYLERSLCSGKMALKKQMLVKEALSEEGPGQIRLGAQGPVFVLPSAVRVWRPLEEAGAPWLMDFGLQIKEKENKRAKESESNS